jgi:hypothetical protein
MFQVSSFKFRSVLPDNTKPETRNSVPQHSKPAIASETFKNYVG